MKIWMNIRENRFGSPTYQCKDSNKYHHDQGWSFLLTINIGCIKYNNNFNMLHFKNPSDNTYP